MESVDKMIQKLDELEKESNKRIICNAILANKARKRIETKKVIDKYHLFIDIDRKVSLRHL